MLTRWLVMSYKNISYQYNRRFENENLINEPYLFCTFLHC